MIASELNEVAVRSAVEAIYGRLFTWRAVISKDDEDARYVNSRLMNELGGLLFRAYVEDGLSVVDAHEHMSEVRNQVRRDYLSGRTFVDWLTPVNRASAHVLVADREPELRILMQHRDDRDGVASRGMWSIPGGAVEDGESPHAAALRELAEETALTAEHLVGGDLLACAGSYVEVRPAQLVRRYLYRADIDARALDSVRCLEGRAMTFLPLQHIRTLDLTVVAAEALKPYFRIT